MKGRRSLQELVQDAGVSPILVRQPCLPAPSQPAIIASEEDHVQARNLLAEQRRRNPDYKDPNKELKRLFRTSKTKEKLLDTNRWEFSQDELDHALSAVIDKPTTNPGLVQAFLSLGAKVNYVDTSETKKGKNNKPDNTLRRRSTVLQQAATLRRADSVNILASSGADQTTLDEGLKAALAANDHSCTQELLRHGADINKFPNALADAVRSNDQNLVKLLLRAPKALRSEVISSCLPAAVQQKSEAVISLLIGYGADPNFNSAGALHMAISAREYRLAVALVAGSIPLTPVSLQGLSEPVLKMPTAQELYQFLQLLFCCGLSPATPGLPGLLVAASKRNDTPLASLLVTYGVPTTMNEAECLRIAIMNSNWRLADAILETNITANHASVALAVLPANAPPSDRFRVISALVRKGATGPPLGRWLVRAVEEGDFSLMDLLLNAGAPLESGNNRALSAAVARKDMHSLRTLLNSRPPPEALSQVFPMIRSGYSPSERLETTKLLLAHGARGTEVDQALVDAVADTSSTRDVALITELVRNGASVNHNNGEAIRLAVTQADASILRLLCNAKPSAASASAALPLAFDTSGGRHSSTLQIIELLLNHGVEEKPALEALQTAIIGGSGNLDIVHRIIAANARLLGPAFQSAIGIEDVRKKAPILTSLLKMGIPQGSLDAALITEVRHVVVNKNSTILKILLEYGASVNYNDGEALSIGIASGQSALVSLLLNGKEIPSRASTTKSLRALFYDAETQSKAEDQGSIMEIAQDLLRRGVDQPAIDAALRSVMDPANHTRHLGALVELLLSHRADVNTAEGVCFVYAAKRKDYSLFAKLLAHNPDFPIIVPALMAAKLEEEAMVKSLELCFDHGCLSDDLGHGGRHKKPPLVLAMQEYPRSGDLVRVLLDQGCNPDAVAYETIDESVGEEALPAIVWALAQPQKLISSSAILALLNAGASPTRPAPKSEITPIALASREGRADLVQDLLERGADASARDKWNRSALFYASRTSLTSIVQSLSAYALKDDGSLHEAASYLQLDVAKILIKQGHSPNFPSRLHSGRNALGELCLNADITNGNQRSKVRQLIRIFLDHGANPKFKARNEKSAVLLALDNPHSALEISEALLETEIWEDINDEKHMYRSETGLWYSPLKYVELIPSASRAPYKQSLTSLLLDKGCEPKFYSEEAEQPDGAIGMPASIAALHDRQKEHQLSLKLAKEAAEAASNLEESAHRDALRRKQEQQDADMAAAAAAQSHFEKLEQQKHEFEMQRVRSAERMKRSEKVAWHSLQMEQERDAATQRLQIDDTKAKAAYAAEAKMIAQRESELEHRTGIERKALLEKEQLFQRNVERQKSLTQRLDESAQLHARLRQDRPAIEGAQWGNVD